MLRLLRLLRWLRRSRRMGRKRKRRGGCGGEGGGGSERERPVKSLRAASRQPNEHERGEDESRAAGEGRRTRSEERRKERREDTSTRRAVTPLLLRLPHAANRQPLTANCPHSFASAHITYKQFYCSAVKKKKSQMRFKIQSNTFGLIGAIRGVSRFLSNYLFNFFFFRFAVSFLWSATKLQSQIMMILRM